MWAHTDYGDPHDLTSAVNSSNDRRPSIANSWTQWTSDGYTDKGTDAACLGQGGLPLGRYRPRTSVANWDVEAFLESYKSAMSASTLTRKSTKRPNQT